MDNREQLRRPLIYSEVISSLNDVLARKPERSSMDPEESTHLIGRESGMDSLDLVTLIIDLEQKLEAKYGVCLTLANDRAMSQRNSPFRTVRSLTDHICSLIEDEEIDGRA